MAIINERHHEESQHTGGKDSINKYMSDPQTQDAIQYSQFENINDKMTEDQPDNKDLKDYLMNHNHSDEKDNSVVKND